MSKKFGSSVGFPYQKIEKPVVVTGTTHVDDQPAAPVVEPVVAVDPVGGVDPVPAFEIDEPKTEGWKAKRDKKKQQEEVTE